MPVWGDLRKRAALWELTTAMSLLYAGADILIMYQPGGGRCLEARHRPPDGYWSSLRQPQLTAI